MPHKNRDKIPNNITSDLKSEVLLNFYEETSSLPGTKRTRLHRAMLKMIEQGFWDPGDRLPTDIELTDKLPLSIATVQASLNMLAEQGLVTRVKRRGSFISSEENLPRDYFYFQFINSTSGYQMTIDTVDIAVSEEQKKGPWSDFLGEKNKYLNISRVVNIGGEFLILSEFYFSNPNIWVLMDFPLDKLKELAIQQLIHLRLGLPALKQNWAVSFIEFDSVDANRIGVPTGTLGQQFDVSVYTVGDVPLVFHRISVPPNDHSLHIMV